MLYEGPIIFLFTQQEYYNRHSRNFRVKDWSTFSPPLAGDEPRLDGEVRKACRKQPQVASNAQIFKENKIIIEVNFFTPYTERYAGYFSFYTEHNHACHPADGPWLFPKKNKFSYGGIS